MTNIVLAPDPSTGEVAVAGDQNARRPTIPRTNRPLPTDRLKFETQVAALKAIAIKSEYGKRAVGGDDLASALSLATTTAGLNNAFFLDSGLITREGRGQYKPIEIVNEFARKHSFDERAAGLLLAETLAETWYYRAVRERLSISGATREQMIGVLAHEAGATKERELQLGSLLDWLQYGGLIDARGGEVKLVDPAATPTPENGKEPEAADHKHEPPPSDPAPARATTPRGQAPSQDDSILSLNFEFSLTATDLSKLQPEQIKTLFESVGSVMAIKATAMQTDT